MTMYERARRRGAGDQGISLSDAAIRGLVAIISRDLGLEYRSVSDPFDGRSYFDIPVDSVALENKIPAIDLFEQLLNSGSLRGSKRTSRTATSAPS